MLPEDAQRVEKTWGPWNAKPKPSWGYYIGGLIVQSTPSAAVRSVQRVEIKKPLPNGKSKLMYSLVIEFVVTSEDDAKTLDAAWLAFDKGWDAGWNARETGNNENFEGVATSG